MAQQRTGDAETRIAPAWLGDPGLRAVLKALQAEGATARFVGGCVRNALMSPRNDVATDIDIAIDCAPQETIRLLESAGLKAIPTGVDHGTVTALTPKDGSGDGFGGGEPVEVTSLRRDVETDGRRAVVAFTTDWAEDAGRRDFTMNALYADADGVVFDPLGGGVADLATGRLRFIGRAEDRIREDYLRILRYFRFFAWYGAAGGLEPDDLAAIARLRGGVDNLARERIGAEIRKMFAASDPTEATRAMVEVGVLAQALPGATLSASEAEDRLRRLLTTEQSASLAPRWMRRLAALLGDGRGAALDVDALTGALKLSKAEGAAIASLTAAAHAPAGESAYRWGRDAASDAAALAAAARGEAIPIETLSAIATGAEARLPITAKELMAQGLKPGPQLGEALRAAESAWIAQGFEMDRDALIAIAIAEAKQRTP